MDTVELTEEQRPAALAALYNASKPLGMGILHYTPEEMTEAEAAELLKETSYFDYLKGRVMKLNFKYEPLDLRLYDRDNGAGAGHRALVKAGVITE
jgi:hypothetical protein